MKKKYIIFILTLCMIPCLFGCRGDKTENQQILLIQNMVDQTSYGPQSKNEFYKDKKSAREAVPGTVAQGEDFTNTRFYKGLEPNSTEQNPNWVKKFPMPLTQNILKRGQDRFNIYCSPCHGYTANNEGLVTQAAGGSIRPANLHDVDKIARPVGKIYDAVTNGVNQWNMPGFLEQMNVEDRWAVVAYVRALQLSNFSRKANK